MALSEPNKIDLAPPVGTGRIWCLCVLILSLFYAMTAQRGVCWQDSGTFQWRVLNADYIGRHGLASAHSLYIAVGQIIKTIPIGTLEMRLNVFSGLGMAVALANLMAVLTLLTGRRWVGLLIAAMLATAHSVWWLATVSETYTWCAAGLTAELWFLVCLVRRPSWRVLAGLAFCSGLGLSLHNLALLPLPIYFVLVIVLIARRRLGAWSLVAAAIAWLIGASLCLGLMIQHAVDTGDIGAAVQTTLFGNYATEVLNASSVPRNFKANMAISSLNFVSMLGPLAIVGWIGMRRRLGRTLALALGSVTVIEALFFIRYPIPDQFTFILPTLIMIALSAGIGLSVLADTTRRVRICAVTLCLLSVVAQPVFYAACPGLLRASGIRVNRRRSRPFRDEMRYWLVPWKHNEGSAQRFAVAALGLARPDGVILADSTEIYSLLLMRAGNPEFKNVGLPGVGWVLPSYDDDPQGYRAVLAGRSLYIVSPKQGGLSPGLLADTEVVPCPADSPVLYRLEWKHPSDIAGPK
jgi:hypothetical protein